MRLRVRTAYDTQIAPRPSVGGVTDAEIRRATGADITTADLYALLELRAAVFVVEQDCAYLDPDGLDLGPSTVHLWIDGGDEQPAAYLRVLTEPDGTLRIGRVVTHPAHRGQRLAGRLLEAAVEGATVPVVLNAQAHLMAVYERHGFVRDGDDFLDDGIPHTPMRRAARA
jgi:ElaA protein